MCHYSNPFTVLVVVESLVPYCRLFSAIRKATIRFQPLTEMGIVAYNVGIAHSGAQARPHESLGRTASLMSQRKPP
jgi:hypothetical protein